MWWLTCLLFEMEKEKAVAKLHKRINKISRKIDNLALQTHLAEAEAKTAFNERIASLESQKNNFRDEVHHLKHHTSTLWQDLYEGCNTAWFDMKMALRNATDDFKS
jgi:chaperonin cofactor prefoldin